MSDFDVIVIGSGIGGLTAAGLLARAGKSVLVLERHDRPGGYAHGFKRKKYHFDAGVHLISGSESSGYRGGQIIHKILHALGVERDIRFISIDPFCQAFYPGLTVHLPQTIEAFVNELSIVFPDERQGLHDLVVLCQKLTEEIAAADELMSRAGIGDAQLLMPALYRYRKATLAEVAGNFIKDPKLLALFASNWPYLGLPPSQVSFVYWATMLIGYMVDGAFYCEGGFQKLPDVLVKGLKQWGGEIQYRAQVSRILVENGNVTGVMVKGTRFSAPVVVANADLRQTVYDLVGAQHFPSRFIQRLEKMQHSLSIFVVYIATDIDLQALNIAHESFCYPSFDHDQHFARTSAGEVNWISITAPTLVQPDLAPPGQHLLLLTTLLPYQAADSWTEVKKGYMESMLKLAGRYIPDLEKRILYIDGGTPATMLRYTGNHEGAAYGWDVSPSQVGPARIPNQSPLNGLYFAGHWTSPGGGVYGVSISGVKTAQKVLGINRMDDFWQFD